jgi:hypothetical protein
MEKKATLQIALTDTVYAYQLHGMVFVIDDLYTSYRWLEMAKRHNGPLPYDDSAFDVDDFLIVKKLEIGTPNFIELYGLIEPLKQTLLYLGGVAGIVGLLKDGTEAYKNWQEARRNKDREKHKSEHEIAMEKEQLRKAQLENALLEEKIISQKVLNHPFISPLQISRELQSQGKASALATDYKVFGDVQIQDRLQKGVFDTGALRINLIPD